MSERSRGGRIDNYPSTVVNDRATVVNARVSRAPTEFERRVYAVVERIPKGQVRSYRWVAVQLGNAHLARAVGQALKRNPWPRRVPCHRVIRSNGSLGGYAWGIAKKRRLLQRESPGFVETIS